MGTLKLTTEERRKVIQEICIDGSFPVIINGTPYFITLDEYAIFCGYTRVNPSQYFADNPSRLDNFKKTAYSLEMIMDDIIEEYESKISNKEEAKDLSAKLTIELKMKRRDKSIQFWYTKYPQERYPDRYL